MNHVRMIVTVLPLIYGIAASAIPDKSEVISIITRVNGYWQSSNPQPGRLQ